MHPQNPVGRRPEQKGFTLIEVMITVAIIAILAAIALPSYNQYIIRSKLIEAPNYLADTRVKMEQYYQDNRNYGASTGTACGATMPTAKYFTYTCATSSTAQAFTVTAGNLVSVGLGAASDYAYTIDQSNAKVTTTFKGATQSGKNCWLVSGTEC